MRAVVKAAVESLLLGAGAGRLGRAALRSRSLVLAYHNIVPHGAPCRGDRALHLPQANFARQLDALLRTHDVVPLADLLAPGRKGRRLRAVITFDDAYRGAVSCGVEELARRGLPATIFVAPAYVGGGSFWWDRFSDKSSGTLPPGFRDHALHALRGREAEVDAWAIAAGHPPAPLGDHALAASEDELRVAAGVPGITLGSHTWSHPNLAAVDGAELADELVRPLRWLRERFNSVIPWIAYPYGLRSEAAERAAERAGYVAGLRVTGGWLGRSVGDPFRLPRYNVPAGLSQNGFRLRLSGLFCG